MLTLGPAVRIFVAQGATDMRKSFDSLCALVHDVPAHDPFSGHLFCFLNRRRDRLELLVWDRTRFWLFNSRLEQGTFAELEAGRSGCIEITPRELFLLIEGIDVRTVRQRKRYFRVASA